MQPSPRLNIYRARMAKVLRVVCGVVCLVILLIVLQLMFVILEIAGPEAFRSAVNWRSGNISSEAAQLRLSCCGDRQEVGEEGSPAREELNPLPLRPAGVGHYSFVLLSAYRQNFTTLHVIGHASRLIRNTEHPAFQCLWRAGSETDAPAVIGGNDSELAGVVTSAVAHYGNTDHTNLPYAEVVLTCQFGQDVGADGLGGSLYVVVRAANIVGGDSFIQALREEAGYDFPATTAKPYPYKFAFCSAPIAGEIRADILREWLIYHLYIYEGPKVHFFFYDVGGLTKEGRDLLHPFVKAGLLSILDVFDQSLYPAWYHSQVLLINECLHRTRFLADWTIFHDFDEFMYVTPPNTFSSLLEANSGAPAVTFGSWPISISNCRAQETETEWPIERMLWRQPRPECRDKRNANMCTAAAGRRKYAVNPRKEILASVHRILGPAYMEVLNFNATVARMEHYHGLLSANRNVCTWIRKRSIPVDKDPGFFQKWMELEPVIIPDVQKAKEYVGTIIDFSLKL